MRRKMGSHTQVIIHTIGTVFHFSKTKITKFSSLFYRAVSDCGKAATATFPAKERDRLRQLRRNAFLQDHGKCSNI